MGSGCSVWLCIPETSSLTYLFSLLCLCDWLLELMAPSFDALSKVYPEREAWRIRVRIIRLWNVHSFNNSQLPSSIEMVLLDEFGGKIQGSVRKTLVYKFSNLLSEGNVYQMSYFTVTPNIGSYRATNHEFRFIFQFRTTVVPCESVMIPQYGLSCVPFVDVMAKEADSDFLIDVMGLLVGTSIEKEYDRNGKQSKLVMIELSDCNQKLECALFGEYVEQLNSFLAEGNVDLPVVVIQLAKVKLFRGQIVLQNVMHATKILFNPPIAEVINFRKRLAEDTAMGSQPLRVIPDVQRTSLEDEFMKLHEKKSIDQLNERKEDGLFIVLGTVKAIVEDASWWYCACKCNRSVIPDSGMYYCGYCLCHVTSVTPRYRIKVEVNDDTGSVVFVLFDRDAQNILKKPCAQLLSEYKKLQSEGDGSLPNIISALVGQKFLFKVEKKSVSSSHYDDSFCVRRVCIDEHIVSMFMLQVADDSPTKGLLTPPVPQTYSLDDDIQCVETISPKEFTSQVIDNPVSLSCDVTMSLYKKPAGKRKFDEAVDDVNDRVGGVPLKPVKIEKN